MVKEIVFVGEGEKAVRWNAVDFVLKAGVPTPVDADTADGLTANHSDVVYAEGFARERANLPEETPEVKAEEGTVEEVAKEVIPEEASETPKEEKKGKK